MQDLVWLPRVTEFTSLIVTQVISMEKWLGQRKNYVLLISKLLSDMDF